MKRALFGFALGLAVVISASVVTLAQETTIVKKEVVQNPDGSYTVIEYPVGKEVVVNLSPGTTVVGSKGAARVIRAADGTKIFVDVSGVPGGTASYYAYAVDPAGVPTLLGPIAVTDGIAKAEFSTPLNQFMVVLSPTEGLTTIDSNTAWVYRSDLPAGYTIVPRMVGDVKAVVITRPDATTTPAAYEVPLLNVPSFGDKQREVKLKFSGELSELEAIANIERSKGATKVKMRFDDMKSAPANKRFVLWASSSDGKYTKLGQVVTTGRKDKAVIESQTALTDFGLFLTVEDNDVMVPTSRIYSVFAVPQTP